MTIPIPITRPATKDALKELKRMLGHLPPDFQKFLTAHDGARPDDNSLGLRHGETSLEEFIKAEEIPKLSSSIDGFPRQAMVIAADGSGNYVYMSATDGHIYFWDHEIEGSDEKIAVTFDQFLAKLQPVDPDAVKLEPGQVKRAWVNPDFKPEF